MLILFKNGQRENDIQSILDILHTSGTEFTLFENQDRLILKIQNSSSLPLTQWQSFPQIDRVIPSDRPYPLVHRDYRPEGTVVKVGDLRIGEGAPLVIAGPCAVENETQLLETARLVHEHGIRLMRGGAFKPRTSPYSFTGLGEKGLKLLHKARQEFGVYIVTEVLDAMDVPLVAEYADVLQIGSRNMQNYKLLKAVGRIHKPVLLKRGMSARLDEFLMSAEYIMSEGNEQIILCERGIRTFVEYSRNTLDLNVVPMVKQLSHLPIIVDPSHGTGRRDLVIPMSLAALAAGANGLMVEVHPHPDQALSDAEQALGPEQFAYLMEQVNSFIRWQYHHEHSAPLY